MDDADRPAAGGDGDRLLERVEMMSNDQRMAMAEAVLGVRDETLSWEQIIAAAKSQRRVVHEQRSEWMAIRDTVSPAARTTTEIVREVSRLKDEAAGRVVKDLRDAVAAEADKAIQDRMAALYYVAHSLGFEESRPTLEEFSIRIKELVQLEKAHHKMVTQAGKVFDRDREALHHQLAELREQAAMWRNRHEWGTYHLEKAEGRLEAALTRIYELQTFAAKLKRANERQIQDLAKVRERRQLGRDRIAKALGHWMPDGHTSFSFEQLGQEVERLVKHAQALREELSNKRQAGYNGFLKGVEQGLRNVTVNLFEVIYGRVMEQPPATIGQLLDVVTEMKAALEFCADEYGSGTADDALPHPNDFLIEGFDIECPKHGRFEQAIEPTRYKALKGVKVCCPVCKDQAVRKRG